MGTHAHHQPYFDEFKWDWRHYTMYIPPEKDSGYPALVRSNNVFHFSFPVFGGYMEHALVSHKYLLRNCIEQVLSRPLIKAKNLPSFAQVTVLKQQGRRTVHVPAYVPELRGKVQVIEEPICVRDVEIALRTDDLAITQAYLAPSKAKLPYSVRDGYTIFTIPEVNGYQMAVIE